MHHCDISFFDLNTCVQIIVLVMYLCSILKIDVRILIGTLCYFHLVHVIHNLFLLFVLTLVNEKLTLKFFVRGS